MKLCVSGVLPFHIGESRVEVLVAARRGRPVSLSEAAARWVAPDEPPGMRVIKAPLRALNNGRWSLLGTAIHPEDDIELTTARALVAEAGMPPGFYSMETLSTKLLLSPSHLRTNMFVSNTYFLELKGKPDLGQWPSRDAPHKIEWRECRWVSTGQLPRPVHSHFLETVGLLGYYLAAAGRLPEVVQSRLTEVGRRQGNDRVAEVIVDVGVELG